jgi:hypothetical protein
LNPLGNGTTCNAIAYHNNQIWFVRNDGDSRIIGLNENTGVIETNQAISASVLELIYCRDLLFDNNELAVAAIDFSTPGNIIPIIYKCDIEGNEIFQASPEEAQYDWNQYNEHLVQSPDGGYVSWFCEIR